MKTGKVLRRLTRVRQEPVVLQTVARDVGFALARGERDELVVVAREIAANAPDGDADEAASRYWAGFSAAMGMVLAAYEAAHEHQDARAAALRALGSTSARSVLIALHAAPATGAELAAHLGFSASAVSKILKSLRNAGLARVLGGPDERELPERGARKPHALTPMGTSLAVELDIDDVGAKQLNVAAH